MRIPTILDSVGRLTGKQRPVAISVQPLKGAALKHASQMRAKRLGMCLYQQFLIETKQNELEVFDNMAIPFYQYIAGLKPSLTKTTWFAYKNFALAIRPLFSNLSEEEAVSILMAQNDTKSNLTNK